jgi:PsbP
MQKKISITIFSIFALSLISVLITVILMHSYSYSRNSDNNNNNNYANIVPLASHTDSHYNISPATSFLTYQDPVYGIKIQYPSDWEKIKLGKDFIVGFVSPSSRDSGVLENVMISATRLSSQATSLNNFGNTRISTLESQYRDFHLVSSGPFITSTGSPLYKIEYTHTEGTLPITTTEIWSLKGAEAFMLLANVDTSETSTYMPIFQKMINSFSSSSFSPSTPVHQMKVHSV